MEKKIREKLDYELFKAIGLCPVCKGRRKAKKGKMLCVKCLDTRKRYIQRMQKTNPGKLQATMRKSTRKVREETLAAYGSQCACCNETFEPFLVIDHIKGGGNAHRRKNNIIAGTQTYYWLRKRGYPSGFRVLCWSCNACRHYYGVCKESHPGHLD